MGDSAEAHAPVLAAGGIVLQEGSRPRFAIVRLRRDKSWVLPKGKLHPGEHALAAAKREVMEETGYDVSVHQFLGTMSYSEAAGRIKVVQFWHMRVVGGPNRELTPDVKVCKMAVVETSHRDARARSRKGVSRECGADCVGGR